MPTPEFTLQDVQDIFMWIGVATVCVGFAVGVMATIFKIADG